jgi:hypothetical protein
MAVSAFIRLYTCKSIAGSLQPSLSGDQSGKSRFQIAHFADEYHI